MPKRERTPTSKANQAAALEKLPVSKNAFVMVATASAFLAVGFLKKEPTTIQTRIVVATIIVTRFMRRYLSTAFHKYDDAPFLIPHPALRAIPLSLGALGERAPITKQTNPLGEGGPQGPGEGMPGAATNTSP